MKYVLINSVCSNFPDKAILTMDINVLLRISSESLLLAQMNPAPLSVIALLEALEVINTSWRSSVQIDLCFMVHQCKCIFRRPQRLLRTVKRFMDIDIPTVVAPPYHILLLIFGIYCSRSVRSYLRTGHILNMMWNWGPCHLIFIWKNIKQTENGSWSTHRWCW